MKCGKCGEEVEIKPGKSANFCSNCGNKIEAEKSGDWKYFDNTKDLLAYVAAKYGNDALFSKKYLYDHAEPMWPQGQKKLVSEAFSSGAVKILQDNMTADQPNKEIAVKQAVKKLTDLEFSQESAGRVIWAFTNAVGWGMPEPQSGTAPPDNGGRVDPTQPKKTPAAQSPQAVKPPQTQNVILSDASGKSNNLSVYPSVGSIINVANIDWRVLTVENKKALLISEKIIEKLPYNVELKDITWENCTLRKYLNNEFYYKLGAAKSAIAETRNNNPNNPWYGTAGGNVTTDKVFLLSLEELVKYFGDNGDLRNKRQKDYNGKNDSTGYYLHDQYNSARIANFGNEGALWWWLRSPGGGSDDAANVGRGGRVRVTGRDVDYDSGGVRPALWLNL